MTPKGESTEVDAYAWINENLKLLGWDTRSPIRYPTGQVYTQNEALGNPEIAKFLHRDKPENIIKITEKFLWVVEAKKDHKDLGTAISEAEDYAKCINDSKILKVKMITGVAGNRHDSYIMESRFLKDKEWIPVKINKKEISGFLTPDQAKNIVTSDDPNIDDVQIDEKLFVQKAKEINEILHLGAVNPHDRASVMAALLLSMIDDTQPNIDAAPSVLVKEINARVERILNKQHKPEFKDYIELTLPATEDNHIKLRNAIVATIQELNTLNIRSAMNSGVDVLGKFYEVFLKYANWAQDLGIVLTPRHLTQFAAYTLDIGQKDIVYDPTCGTGGFLVAAFDHVRKKITESQLDSFKQNSLFGVEQDAGIASLAIVNMIFRGDGKTNIIEGNCFMKFLTANSKDGIASAKFVDKQSMNPPITKILMNPPFALKKSDEKEYKFINQALNQMEDGGMLFSVLPYSCMVKPGKFKLWREQMLKENTLLSVITFPGDIFYPIGVTTVGIFVKKGNPHPADQKVLWIRALNDGLRKSKGKRLPDSRVPNDFETVKDIVRAFINNPSIKTKNIDEFIKAQSIDSGDGFLELVPEAYLDQSPPNEAEIGKEAEQMVRDAVAFLIKSKMEDEANADK